MGPDSSGHRIPIIVGCAGCVVTHESSGPKKTARRQSPGLGTVDAAEWRHAVATRRTCIRTCDFTKRTHRFLTDFLMEVPMNTLVAQEMCERHRWVRFEKRTHREAVLGSFYPESGFVLGC